MRFGSLTPRGVAVTAAVTVMVVDQVTKVWAVAALSDGPVTLISGFLWFRLVRNAGAAFGLLPGAGAVIAMLALVAAAAILIAVRTMERRIDALALGLVLGGALGNLIDRIVRGDGFLDGRVVDFIDFDFFPTFNVADTAITIGAILALWLAMRSADT